MLFAGDRQVEDMGPSGITLVGAGAPSLGATPAELGSALALLKRVAAKLAEYATFRVQVAQVDDLVVGKTEIFISGNVFVAVNAALAIAQIVPLSQDGTGDVGKAKDLVAKLQQGIAALVLLADTARAGAAPSTGLSTGAKVGLGLGALALVGGGLLLWSRRRR